MNMNCVYLIIKCIFFIQSDFFLKTLKCSIIIIINKNDTSFNPLKNLFFLKKLFFFTFTCFFFIIILG